MFANFFRKKTEDTKITISGEKQFSDNVFPDEYKSIRGNPDPDGKQEEHKQNGGSGKKTPKPDPAHNLIGLALSGGGIRSATFGLGILQHLAEVSALKHIDYLSTVSGGGYIGSCLSALLYKNPKSPGGNQYSTDYTTFPFRTEPGEQESKPCRHLRNHSNYLAPKSFLQTLEIPAILLRGVLLNFMVFLPWIVATVFIIHLVFGWSLNPEQLHTSKDWPAPSVNDLRWGASYQLSKYALYLFIFFLFITPIILRRYEKSCRDRQLDELIGREKFRECLGWAAIILLFVFILETLSQSILLYRQPPSWTPRLFQSADYATLASVLGALIPVLSSKIALETTSRIKRILILGVAAFFGLLALWMIFAMLARWTIFMEPPGIFDSRWAKSCIGVWAFVYGGLGLVLFALTRATECMFIDPNKTSLHRFYRDRLSNAYLFHGTDINTDGGFNKLKLWQLGRNRPYHLINSNINLQGSKNPDLRGRDGDFFLFSPLYTGSYSTGYIRTRKMETLDHHLNLGTAFSISGAAASPNMGASSNRILAFLMTLLNVRLGYWLYNPQKLISGTFQKRLGFYMLNRVGPICLFDEMRAKLNEKSSFVNISDGGHIENLGIYELLRRRCKVIIVSDAECDPELTFPSLIQLIRYAWIDMGIRIAIKTDDIACNLQSIKKGKKADNSLQPPDQKSLGFSCVHCAAGKIYYGHKNDDTQTGYLLYLKASLTGDENEDILRYREEHETFPHQTTADQIYDEAQFESYRSLGYHVAKSVGITEADTTDITTLINRIKEMAETQKSCSKNQTKEES